MAAFLCSFSGRTHAFMGHSRHARVHRRVTPLRLQAQQQEFHKYQGTGNDFILVDNRKSDEVVLTAEDSKRLCDRHYGVGADGVIFLLPKTRKDSNYTMRIFNSDGSEPEMCGNGIRCLARFAFELEGGANTSYRIDTGAGVIVPAICDDQVRVDMGEPILEGRQIPTTLSVSERSPSAAYDVDGTSWEVTPVSMGNPHAIIFVSKDDFDRMNEDLERVGPLFENHEAFPSRTNTEFIFVRSDKEIDFLVWERGAGRTLACGTGACAAAVACILTNRTGRSLQVNLPGGPLCIEWSEENNHVYMTGPAEFVFRGMVGSAAA